MKLLDNTSGAVRCQKAEDCHYLKHGGICGHRDYHDPMPATSSCDCTNDQGCSLWRGAEQLSGKAAHCR